jgi:hypothetical protein
MDSIRNREALLQQHTATLTSNLKSVSREHGAQVSHSLRRRHCFRASFVSLIPGQLLLLQVARTRVASQMKDADALQGKLDAMNMEVT